MWTSSVNTEVQTKELVITAKKEGPALGDWLELKKETKPSPSPSLVGLSWTTGHSRCFLDTWDGVTHSGMAGGPS